MSAAGDRIAELLDRWLASVELHERYLKLDDAAYAAVQDWPRHQRPTRWIVELARTRCLELQRQLQEREAGGDGAFADGLELMAFLTNLLGSEHLERFIPLANPGSPRRVARTPEPAATAAAAREPAAVPARQPAPAPARQPAAAHPQQAATPPARQPASAAAETSTTARKPAPAAAETSTTATVETPRPAASRSAAKARTPGARSPARTGEPARTSRTAPATRRTPHAGDASRGAAPATAADPSRAVIADAVRLLRWGREWPELAGLIARLSGRPPEAEVWGILRKHRSAIEARAAEAD